MNGEVDDPRGVRATEAAQHLDQLLSACVAQGRMRLPGKPYEPCYRVVV